MKRLQIITKPTSVDDLIELESDSYGGAWELRAERLEAQKMRKFKQHI